MTKKSRRPQKSHTEFRAKEISASHEKLPTPPKKPLTAYFYYSNERKPILSKEKPKLNERDMSHMLADEWRAMSASERAKYEDIAKKEHENYLNKKKEYDEKRKALKESKKVEESKSEPPKKDMPPTTIPQSSIPNCGIHNEAFRYWCKTCNDWICEFCVTKHSSDGHNCVHLLDFAQTNLLTELGAIQSHNEAASGVSKAITENLTKLAETYKRLVSAFSLQLKIVNDTMTNIESTCRKYKNANTDFAQRLDIMKQRVPEYIKSKNLPKLYDYLKRIEVMKKTTQTDETDVKSLESTMTQLASYISDFAKPLDTIVDATRGITKKVSALSDI